MPTASALAVDKKVWYLNIAVVDLGTVLSVDKAVYVDDKETLNDTTGTTARGERGQVLEYSLEIE